MGSSVTRGIRIGLCAAALALTASAQSTVAGPFTVPAGSSKLQIAQTAEMNWRLGATFECKIVGERLKVIGKDNSTPCFTEFRFFTFDPQTMSGQTSSDIQFELRITCPSPTTRGRIPFTAELNLDGQGFVLLAPGTTNVLAANGDVIRVNNTASGPGPAMESWHLALLAIAFLAVATVALRGRLGSGLAIHGRV